MKAMKRMAPAAALLIGTTGATTLGAIQEQDQDTHRVIKRVVKKDGGSDVKVKQESKTVEVHVESDDVSVKINGKEIPADRIKREDGKLIIIGEDGKVMENIKIGVAHAHEGEGHGGVWTTTKDGNVMKWHEEGGQVFHIGEGEGDIAIAEIVGSHGDGGHVFHIGEGEDVRFFGDDENIMKFEVGDNVLHFMGDDSLVHFGEENLAFGMAEPPKVIIGIQMEEPSDALRHHLRLHAGHGVMIATVIDDSPAENAGLHQYDVIVRVDGEAVTGAEVIKEALSDKEAGDEIELVVIHAGDKHEVEVKLAPYESELHTFFAQPTPFSEIGIPHGTFKIEVDDQGHFNIGEELQHFFQFEEGEEGENRFFIAPGHEGFRFNLDDEGNFRWVPGEELERFFVAPGGKGQVFVQPGHDFALPHIELPDLEKLHEHLGELHDVEKLHEHLGELRVNPRIERLDISDFRERGAEDKREGDGDLDDRLERLYDRIAELEAMLEKLLDRAGDR